MDAWVDKWWDMQIDRWMGNIDMTGALLAYAAYSYIVVIDKVKIK